jgi:threonine dehydrogenase-like Zn-dependent dehydrogenase
VTRFKAGDLAGVGCFVDSCRECGNCRAGLEQYCDAGVAWTYNGTLPDKKTRTYGGYSEQIVVDEKYILRISHRSNLAAVAPEWLTDDLAFMGRLDELGEWSSVAVADGEVVGYVMNDPESEMPDTDDPFLEVVIMAVRPDKQGLGFGRR